ncbi:MAG: phenylalanine--tRNA ligase subunit alpha [Acidobacteriota bacterium]
MERQIKELRASFRSDLAAAADLGRLEQIRILYLGKKSGRLTLIMRGLGKLEPSQRPRLGQQLNLLKEELETALAGRQKEMKERDDSQQKTIDVTLPGQEPQIGGLHPITLVRRELEDVFSAMGYSVEDGPEVETEFHNFEALNIPPDHPARNEHDTFFAGAGRVLRTHTSPVQIRTMLKTKPPLKFIAPGMVFRRDAIDPNHTPVFFQLEGLAVAEGISMADLKGTLTVFWKRLLGDKIRVRFRPSYFPFVEPGAEVDISCFLCKGQGCRACGQGGWIEIMGAGMVHPAVFEAVGYDSSRVSGFAFGMGIDRIAKLKYGLDDLRLFWENDVRFLSQFKRGGLV